MFILIGIQKDFLPIRYVFVLLKVILLHHPSFTFKFNRYYGPCSISHRSSLLLATNSGRNNQWFGEVGKLLWHSCLSSVKITQIHSRNLICVHNMYMRWNSGALDKYNRRQTALSSQFTTNRRDLELDKENHVTDDQLSHKCMECWDDRRWRHHHLLYC